MKAPSRSCRLSVMRVGAATVFPRLSVYEAASKPADTWHDFSREATHLCFKRLELEHEQFDASLTELNDAFGDLIIAPNKASRRAAVAADAWRLRHGLRHHRIGIGI